MCPSVNPGVVAGDVPVGYWPIFSLSLATVPEVFAKVYSGQFPSRIRLITRVCYHWSLDIMLK